MADWSELKQLAHEVTEGEVEWLDAGEWRAVMAEDWADFVAACTPDAILALIAENERLRQSENETIEGSVAIVCANKKLLDERDQLRAEVEALRQRAEYWKQRAKSAEGHLFTSDWRAARHALHMHTALASTPWDALTDSQQAQISSAAGAVIAEVNARREVRMPHDAAMSKGGQGNG